MQTFNDSIYTSGREDEDSEDYDNDQNDPDWELKSTSRDERRANIQKRVCIWVYINIDHLKLYISMYVFYIYFS